MNKQTKQILWTVAVIASVFLIIRLILLLVFEQNNTMYYSHMFTPMMYPIGMGGMVLFWGLIIFLVYIFFLRDNPTRRVNALELLNKRLSKGEITIQEYEEIKNKIMEEK